MMANVLLGFPNYADKYVLAGGSWSASLPLTLLQDRRISKRARSSNVLTASTQFTVTLDRLRSTAVIAIAGHNLSASSRYRIRASDNAGFSTIAYDSGWLDVWTDTLDPLTGGLEWEDDNFWLMKMTSQEAAYYPGLLLHILNPIKACLYWKIEIDDTSNPAGYIDIGRLIFADAWQPESNYSYGWSIAYEDSTGVEDALGGAEYFDDRPRYRVIRMTLDHISRSESMRQALGLSRVLGVSGEVLVISDPSEKENLMRTSFLARPRSLSPLENPDPSRYSSAFEFKEIIA